MSVRGLVSSFDENLGHSSSVGWVSGSEGSQGRALNLELGSGWVKS